MTADAPARSSTRELSGLRFRNEITLLLSAALLIFVVTVVIGILNGIDAVDFNQKILLTHVHAGTLGWITMAVFASTFWLFGQGDVSGWQATLPRLLAPAAVIAIPILVIAFGTTYGEFRPIMGTITGLVIVGFLVWTAARARAVTLSTPRWGILAALTTSVSGAVFGVLYAFQVATDTKLLPSGGEDAHPATMVVGFLLPVGMSLTEWWLRPETTETPADRAGLVQMGALFAGGVFLILGILLDLVPLIGISLPLQILAVVLFLRRNGRAIRSVAWTEPRAGRLFAVSAIAIVLNIGFIAYLIVRYEGEFDDVPDRLLLALDHIMFIGVMTLSVFGMLTEATRPARAVAAWADNLIFWAVTTGLAGFALGLITEVVWLKRVSTPVLGVGILLALAVFAARVRVTVGDTPSGDAARPAAAV